MNHRRSLFAALVLGASAAHAAPGDLDASFGVMGIAEDSSTYVDLIAVGRQANGRLIVSNIEGYITAYGADGKYDDDFDGDPWGPAGVTGHAADLAVRSDNSILVAGYTGDGFEGAGFFISRLLPDGSLDTSFGGDGQVVTSFPGAARSLGFALAALPGGKALVGGWMAPAPESKGQFAMARYLSDGSLDASFGNGGLVVTDFGDSYSHISDLAVLPDGRILAFGVSQRSGPEDDAVLVRYLDNGSIDTSFGNAGRAVVTQASRIFNPGRMALQADGKIVVVGVSAPLPQSEYLVLRFLANGSLDTGFANAGQLLLPAANSTAFPYSHGAHSVAIQGNGKILIGGTEKAADGTPRSAILRLLPNGQLDPSFGTAGKVVSFYDEVDTGVYDLLLQPDGKLVAAGGAVARLEGDPSGGTTGPGPETLAGSGAMGGGAALVLAGLALLAQRRRARPAGIR